MRLVGRLYGSLHLLPGLRWLFSSDWRLITHHRLAKPFNWLIPPLFILASAFFTVYFFWLNEQIQNFVIAGESIPLGALFSKGLFVFLIFALPALMRHFYNSSLHREIS